MSKLSFGDNDISKEFGSLEISFEKSGTKEKYEPKRQKVEHEDKLQKVPQRPIQNILEYLNPKEVRDYSRLSSKHKSNTIKELQKRQEEREKAIENFHDLRNKIPTFQNNKEFEDYLKDKEGFYANGQLYISNEHITKIPEELFLKIQNYNI